MGGVKGPVGLDRLAEEKVFDLALIDEAIKKARAAHTPERIASPENQLALIRDLAALDGRAVTGLELTMLVCRAHTIVTALQILETQKARET